MVSEVVDAGTVLFQHPVWIDPNSDWEQMRQNVRKREQSILPRVWEQILKSDLRIEDLKASSSSVRKRLGLNKAFFEDSRGII